MKITTLVLLFLTASFIAPAQQKVSRPNILIILADDPGYHDVSYYNKGEAAYHGKGPKTCKQKSRPI